MAQGISPARNKAENQTEGEASILYEAAFIWAGNGDHWNDYSVFGWRCNRIFVCVAIWYIFIADQGKDYDILERVFDMTKAEYGKCEKLMEKAVKNAKRAKFLWEEYEKYSKDNNSVEAEVNMRNSDQHYGYAEGIRDALAVLGFKNEQMKELSELL